MSVKRYRYDFQSGLVADDKGGLVSYADYEKLAAENAGLKSAIEKHADSYIICGYCRTERDGKNDDVCEVLDSTPATEAFLAEVRAQAVEMFAKEMHADISGDDAREFAAQLRKGVQS